MPPDLAVALPHVRRRLIRRHHRQVVLGRRAERGDDHLQLLQRVAPREERFAAQQLGEDASDRPDIDGGPVVLVLDEELGRAVPPRRHILGEVLLRVLFGDIVAKVGAARHPEVGDAQIAVLVDEDVARLEVAVEHVRRVHRLEAAEDLVGEALDVVVGEVLRRADDLVEVGLEELGHEVDVVPAVDPLVVGQQHVVQREDVLVVEVAEQLDLAQHVARVHRVVEGARHLLDRHRLARRRVAPRADQPVRALPHHLGQLVPLRRDERAPGEVVRARRVRHLGAGRGGDGMVAAAAASAVCCSRTWRSRSFAA